MKVLKPKSNKILFFIFSYLSIFFMLFLDFITYIQNKDFEVSIIIALILLFLLLMIISINFYFIKRGWEISSSKIYYSELSMEELFFMLFAVKKCPNCLSKLKKKNKYIFVRKGARKVGISTLEGDIFQGITIYVCEKCKEKYTVSQLIKKSEED